MRLLLAIFFLYVSFYVYPQKTKDHAAVVEELSQKIKSATFSKKPAHIAIVPFTPTQGNASSVNTYGDYLTESIIGQLSENDGSIKVYERKRLDAILKENQLMLSGLMKPSDAIKIGELLPIEALFSGTYTKLKSYIDISGRLIDVTSGEVLMSYSGRVKLTKNIKTLFPAEQDDATSQTVLIVNQSTEKSTEKPSTSSTLDKEAACKQRTDKFREKLNDLSTQEKVNALVAEAMKTPFENSCGKLHYHLIDVLSRYNITQQDYMNFLLNTLDTIAYPAADDRAYSIFSYFTKDGAVDDMEWNSAITSIRKVGNYTLSSYLAFVFSKTSKHDEVTERKRVDEYFKYLNNNEIGLPRAVTYNLGFFEMMEALNKNQPLRLYVYDRYAGKLATENELSVSSHFMYLKKMYEEEETLDNKLKVVNWVADYFTKHVYKKSPEQLYEFAYQFEMEPNAEGNAYKSERNRERLTKYPSAHLDVLLSRCKEKFSAYAIETPYRSQRDDRVNFCVRHNIPVAGIIPTQAEAESILKGNDIKEQLRVMKLLVQMNEPPIGLQSTLISILERKSIAFKEELIEVQSLAMEMLGRLKCSDIKAIAYMISKLTSFNYQESDKAESALANIGKPAVNPLTDRLIKSNNQEGGLQYKIVVILGKIGKDAKPSENALRQLLSKTTNSDIRYAIEATLQAF